MKFQFEENDFWAILTVINVALVIIYGAVGLVFGLTIASMGLISDFTRNPHDFRINAVISHLALIVLNIFFLTC